MQVPSRLYKYESFSTLALENLKNHSLYFASPSGFNDPYDCAVTPSVRVPSDEEIETVRRHYLGKSDTPNDVRRQLQQKDVASLRLMLLRQGQTVIDTAIDDFLRKKGVTCFSARKDSLLMWAHYGGRFKGFCLEFRTDSEPMSRALEVKYSATMPEINIVPLLCEESENSGVLDLYCTKALDWRYEREWRCMHKQAGTLFRYPAEALTGIYMGPDAGFASFEIVSLIVASQNPSVQLWQGKRSKSDFSVVFEPVSYISHLDAKRRGLLSGTGSGSKSS